MGKMEELIFMMTKLRYDFYKNLLSKSILYALFSKLNLSLIIITNIML